MDSLKLPSTTEIYTDLERWRLKQTQSQSRYYFLSIIHNTIQWTLSWEITIVILTVEIHNSAPQNKNTQLNSIINLRCGSLWIISYKLNIEYSSPAVLGMLIFMAQSL